MIFRRLLVPIHLCILLTAILLLSQPAAPANAQPYCDAWTEDCGRYTMSPCSREPLFNPDIPQDYTIHCRVFDEYGDPVTTLAATDLWLEHSSMSACVLPPGQADDGTDSTGYTRFAVNPHIAHSGLIGDASNGVDCNEDTRFRVSAMGIVFSYQVCIATDSPDLNGDCSVDVADFAKYGSDFNCDWVDCDPCHDYNEDGTNNVADFAIFAGYFNSCSWGD